MKKLQFQRPKPRLDPAGEGYPPELRRLLSLGKPKPNQSYADWAEPTRDFVPQLIQMALDEDLNGRPERDKAVWAPIHALNILAAMAPPEAVGPLLELLEWDDEWIDKPLIELFTAVGPDAVPTLEAYLTDDSHTELGRSRAIEGLGGIAEAHEDGRDGIVAFLTAFLDRPHADTVDEETLNGWVISELCDLQATEALETIYRTFDEHRVNTTLISREHVDDELGQSLEPDDESEVPPLRLTLKCQICGRENEYTFAKAYFDPGAIGDEADKPHDALLIPERVVCPKCGAVDQYELGGMGQIALLAKLFAARSGMPDPMPQLQLINFTTKRWGRIPPREALARYASEVVAHPDDVDLRIGYGNSLRIMGYDDQAVAQYEQALMTDPYTGEALINLAQMKSLSGSIPDAIAAWEAIQSKFERLSFPPEDRDMRREEVEGTLTDLRNGARPDYYRETVPLVERDMDLPMPTVGPSPPVPVPTPRDYQDYHEAAPVRPALGQYGKVGRNEPCPCGSGKKYKQCHGKK